MKRFLIPMILIALALCIVRVHRSVLLVNSKSVASVNFSDKVESVIKSVVHIRHSGGWQGSGAIVSEDGLVVTARHVIKSGGEFTVTLDDGRVFTTNESCVSKKHDVGFLKLNATKKLPFSRLGKSSKLKRGETIFCIGSPFGYELFNSVTKGIVSGVYRNVNVAGWSVLIQSDASAAPGSSGGPVYCMNGKLIGIVVGGRYGFDDIVFSVPSEIINTLIVTAQLRFSLEKCEYPGIKPVEDEWGHSYTTD